MLRKIVDKFVSWLPACCGRGSAMPETAEERDERRKARMLMLGAGAGLRPVPGEKTIRVETTDRK